MPKEQCTRCLYGNRGVLLNTCDDCMKDIRDAQRTIEVAKPWVPPKWTVTANLTLMGRTEWIGRSYEFFDEEKFAQQRYDELSKAGHCPTKRPFYVGNDMKHLHCMQNGAFENAPKVAFKVDKGTISEALHTGRVMDLGGVLAEGRKLFTVVSDQDGIRYLRFEEDLTEIGKPACFRTIGIR